MSKSDMVAYYDRYVEAWNDRDPESVMEQFAAGGTLDDPATDVHVDSGYEPPEDDSEGDSG